MVIANLVVKALERSDEHGMVTASVGVASLTEHDGTDAGSDLLRDADAALLEAKRRGKSRAVHFSQVP
jgi:PleD family two-component response regulator